MISREELWPPRYLCPSPIVEGNLSLSDESCLQAIPGLVLCSAEGGDGGKG